LFIIKQHKDSKLICGFEEGDLSNYSTYLIDCDQDSTIVFGDFPTPIYEDCIEDNSLNFTLLPVCAVDENNLILMQAFINPQALQLTVQTKIAHYFSRSRNKLWKKGEESGHIQTLKKIQFLPEFRLFIYHVDQKVAACHTGHYSCFYTTFENSESKINSLKIIEPAEVYKNVSK
jgi:phosphoribosyl-AMP cyclohydrolase